MAEAAKTMPIRVLESSHWTFSKPDLRNTKFTQVSEEDWCNSKSTQMSGNFLQTGLTSPNEDQSISSPTQLSSAPQFSAQSTQSPDPSTVTSNFGATSLSDNSDPSPSLQVTDNACQTLESEYSISSGKEWNFLKYLRKR